MLVTQVALYICMMPFLLRDRICVQSEWPSIGTSPVSPFGPAPGTGIVPLSVLLVVTVALVLSCEILISRISTELSYSETDFAPSCTFSMNSSLLKLKVVSCVG